MVAFPLLSSEVSSGDAMVYLSETVGCKANAVDGSLDAVPLISRISGGIPAVTVDSLVTVVGSGLSVTLLGRKSESANTLQSNGSIPAFRKPAKILDGVIDH
jgi:hypothetical protein